jgi:hypothetical protein
MCAKTLSSERAQRQTDAGVAPLTGLQFCFVPLPLFAILRYKIDIIPVIIGAGVLGLTYKFLRGFS